jgi:hypothetical protein
MGPERYTIRPPALNILAGGVSVGTGNLNLNKPTIADVGVTYQLARTTVGKPDASRTDSTSLPACMIP